MLSHFSAVWGLSSPLSGTISGTISCSDLRLQTELPLLKQQQGQITYLSRLIGLSLQVLDHRQRHILEGAPVSTFWYPWFGPAKMVSQHCQSAEQNKTALRICTKKIHFIGQWCTFLYSETLNTIKLTLWLQLTESRWLWNIAVSFH